MDQDVLGRGDVGRYSTEVAFAPLTQKFWVQFFTFPKIQKKLI